MSNSVMDKIINAYALSDQRHRNMFTYRVKSSILDQFDDTKETVAVHTKIFIQHASETLNILLEESEISKGVGVDPEPFYTFIINMYNECVNINRVSAGKKPLGQKGGGGCVVAAVGVILILIMAATLIF